MSTPSPTELEFPEDLPEDPASTYSHQRFAPWKEQKTPLTGLPVWSTQQLMATPEPGETARPVLDTTFILRELVGQGGFGEVWEAVQVSLGRLVAVKRIQDKHYKEFIQFEEEQAVLEYQFRQEAIVTAQLDHPNIVPVYDLGVDDTRRPLLAMKMIRGQPWGELIREDAPNLSTEEFLAKHLPILISVGQAIAFAHSRGIVHRDIKPSQVMLGKYGEVLLTDWGLALSISKGPSDYQILSRVAADIPTPLTASSPGGTPCLMAPEQTLSTADKVTAKTDIYLLGGTLYYLLTGSYPHEAKSAYLSMRAAREGKVKDPRERAIDRLVPSELADLAMRCLEAAPEARLASADVFVKGLKDYLSGASGRRKSLDLTARVELKLQGFRKSSKEDVNVSGTWTMLRKHVGESAITYEFFAECLSDLDQAAQLWPRNLKLSTVRERVLARYAWTALENNDLMLAQVLSRRIGNERERAQLIAEIEKYEQIREFQRRKMVGLIMAAILLIVALVGFGFKYDFDQREATRKLAEERDQAREVGRTAEKQRLAAEGALAVAQREQYYSGIGLAEAALQQGRVPAAQQVLMQRTPESLRGWEWGHLLARMNPEDIQLIGPQSFHAAWSPDGTRIATGGGGTMNGAPYGSISLWDAATGKPLWRKRTNDDLVWGVEFSPDGAAIAGAANDKTAVIVDAATGEVRKRFAGHTDRVRCVAFSPDGRKLLTTSMDDTFRVWDIESGKTLLTVSKFKNDVYDGHFSPDGKRIVTGSKDHRACVWNAETGELVRELPHDNNVLSAFFTKDGKRVLTSCTDRVARVFDVESGELIRSFDNQTSYLEYAALTPDEKILATADDLGVARLWDFETGARLADVPADDPMWKLSFDPAGKRLLTTSRGSVRVVSLDRFVTRPTLVPTPGNDATATDRQAIRIAHDDMGIGRDWAAPSGATNATLLGHTYRIESRFAVFSPDRSTKISIDPSSKQALVANVPASGSDAASIGPAIEAAFSPDGSLIASIAPDGAVRLYSAGGGAPLRTLSEPTSDPPAANLTPLYCVAFSPNGKFVAAGFPRGVVRLWDAQSGALRREWSDPRGAGACLAFSPDGTVLASGGTEQPSCVWSVENGDLIAHLTGHRRAVFDISFSPDGTRIVTAAKDRMVKLWDAQTGRDLLTLAELPFGQEPLAAAFSDDGLSIIVPTNGAGLRIFESFPAKLASYPGPPDRPFAERLELWKRRQRVAPTLDWDAVRAPEAIAVAAANGS